MNNQLIQLDSALAANKELQREVDELKAQVATLWAVGRNAADQSNLTYMDDLELALDLNPAQCLAQVRHDAIHLMLKEMHKAIAPADIDDEMDDFMFDYRDSLLTESQGE